ncbi:hypothetical protein [uncultured Planktosalinus sp.]|uniref:hypothetical protein n=1 Tax=uncultured Planktosalinus sp. TaxID=1810935 RepID=UPI0030D78C04|tara:strand:- start:1 stop:453 length:453 start_codon:yes stop_codon:yes gene_type:complete
MKVFICLFFLIFSGLLSSQEFGAQFLTIDETTLPEVFQIENSFFIQKYKKQQFSKTLGLSSSNYWQPVSMQDALNKQDSYLNRKPNTNRPINAETLGFSKAVKKERAIQVRVNEPYYLGRNRVYNSVYRDASMPFFYNPFHHRTVPFFEY